MSQPSQSYRLQLMFIIIYLFTGSLLLPFTEEPLLKVYRIEIRSTENVFDQNIVDSDGSLTSISESTECKIYITTLISSPFSLSIWHLLISKLLITLRQLANCNKKITIWSKFICLGIDMTSQLKWKMLNAWLILLHQGRNQTHSWIGGH